MSEAMGSVCPHCQHPIDEDFGLINCSFCGASLFIEMNGEIVSHEKNESEQEMKPEGVSIVESDEENNWREFDGEEMSPPPPLEDFLDENNSTDHNRIEIEESQSTTNPMEPLPLEHQEIHEQQAPEELSSVINEISAYGNSEESSLRDGSLRVRINMTGIDTPELREELRDALMDKKFLWDVEEIMRSIISGDLTLDGLSLLKAAILLERIKGLPLAVSWEQYNMNR